MRSTNCLHRGAWSYPILSDAQYSTSTALDLDTSADPDYLARFDRIQYFYRRRDQWLQVSEPVCRRAQDHDCNLPLSEILLIWNLLIRGDDDPKIGRFGCCQQGTVL
jgi:hypothetical protein